MKTGYTHISLLLDRSGSMDAIRKDVVGGIRNFIKQQQEAEGTCTLTLVQFDTGNDADVVYDGDIKEAPEFGDNYKPRGGTPLLDAMGKLINATGVKLAKMKESERPDKVVFCVVTDGEENRSVEFTNQKVNEMAEHQTSVYGWQFIYLGANQDAFKVADQIGTSRGTSANYAANKFGHAMKTAASNIAAYRAGGQCVALNFSNEQRKAIE